MNKGFITLFVLFFPIFLFAQDKTTIKYFRDIDLKRETKENKARYKMVSISQGNDLTKKLFEIGSDKLIWQKSYRNNMPFGTWYYLNDKNSGIDSVVYGEFKPQGYYSYDLRNHKLLEDVEGEFIKPELIGIDENIFSIAKQRKTSDIAIWIAFNIDYPVEAQIDGIQGDVQTQFTLDEEGSVGHIRITKGVNKLLDIESYQLLNKLPKMLPAKINGNPIKLYIEIPITFLLK